MAIYQRVWRWNSISRRALLPGVNGSQQGLLSAVGSKTYILRSCLDPALVERAALADVDTLKEQGNLATHYPAVDCEDEDLVIDDSPEAERIPKNYGTLLSWTRYNEPHQMVRISTPPNVMINISEPDCLALLSHSLSALITHGSAHLRRIFPKGTRIGSSNFNPVYDKGMQVNEAIFVGTPGWVAKPLSLREPRSKMGGRRALAVDIIGISSLPAPNGRAGKTFSTYLKVQLFHSGKDLEWSSKTIKVKHDIQHGADAFFRTDLLREYENDDLAFLRFLVFEDEFGIDDHIAVFFARLCHIVTDNWVLIRLMDMKGKDSGATLLARFTRSEEQ
ncbi:hypothetical protein D9613_009451 [Agrocybe pediades]|uniref:PI-PLC Y-box domain-containing protein n=1 Tax=Agrocybe pediades TaxID=84607 RepID=A0A8H4R453_9AGAR|nr:hypothetical protein D9613_009451 [Agrocybe pediades]